MRTFAQICHDALAGNPGRPLVTYYDLDSGERTELSVATYANWVAKLASLLAEECDLERGDLLRVDLPTHWLGPIALGAAWSIGVEVIWADDPREAALVLCGPGSIDARAQAGEPVLASALHPLGLRFSDPLPAGVRDLGAEVWSQPDAFTPFDPPDAADPAVPGRAQGELWDEASYEPDSPTRLRSVGYEGGGRLLTTANPASAAGLPAFTVPLATGGSTVWVSGGDEAARQRTYEAERATARLD